MRDSPRPGGAATWTLASLVDDLEQQADGHAQAVRDEELAELAAAEYAEIDLLSRLHGATCGSGEAQSPVVDVRLLGGRQLRGRLGRVGADFLVLEPEAAGPQWVVMAGAVTTISGLGERALRPDARPLPARLGLRSLLRQLVDEEAEVSLVLRDGSTMHGRVRRVGADFLELDRVQDEATQDSQATTVVPTGHVAALGQ